MNRILSSWLPGALRHVALLAMTVISATQAFADDVDSAATPFDQIRATLAAEIKNIVTGLEPDAHVEVFVTNMEPEKVILPGTLTVLQENRISRATNLPRFKTIEVMIFSQLKALPGDVDEIVRRKASLFTKDVKLTMRAPIAGFKVPSSNVRLEADSLSSVSGNIRNMIAGFAAFGLIVILAMAYIGRQLGIQSGALRQSAQSVVQALETASLGGGGARGPAVSATRDNIPLLEGERFQGGSNSNDLLLELSDAGIAALISDAYWCQRDGFAANVWRRLPVARKQVLLGGLDFAKDYANYLTSVAESAEQWEQHPYYLNPLPLWRFDNHQLAAIIRQHPAVLAALPPMRVGALPFPSSEMVVLKEKSKRDGATSPDLQKFNVSPLRRLQSGTLIRSRDEDDDEKLLAMVGVKAQTMREVVSLVWAMQVGEKELGEVLQGFTAAELASAWTAPETVLRRLGKVLPERKLKMVNNYMEKNAPSRNSAAFALLHQRIVEKVAIEDGEDDAALESPAITYSRSA